MSQNNRFTLRGLGANLAETVGRVRRVLPIIARRHKVMLWLAMGIMLVGGALNTLIPVLFGSVVTRVADALKDGSGGAMVFAAAWPFLLLIGGGYLLRELLLVGQKCLVQGACTRIERDMTVVAVSHLIKINLATLAGEKVGAVQGKVARSVDGLVLFLNILYSELLPGFIAIAFALLYVLIVDYRVERALFHQAQGVLDRGRRQTPAGMAQERRRRTRQKALGRAPTHLGDALGKDASRPRRPVPPKVH